MLGLLFINLLDMKKIATFLLLLLLPSGSVYVKKEEIPIDSEMSFVIYSDVPINTKMVNAKSWIATSFGDYKSVLQYEDYENHRIIIKGTATLSTSTSGNAGNKYTASFISTYDFKEDRFRIKYEDVSIHYTVYYNGKPLLEQDYSLLEYVTTIITERYIEKKLNELMELTEQDVSSLSKREKENLQAKIEKVEQEIIEQKEKLKSGAPQIAQQHRDDYQTLFFSLINSAARKIDHYDDF